MSLQFNPRRVLRQISDRLLMEFFEARGQAINVDWLGITETQVNPVFRVWQALPDAERKDIELVLRDVNEMGTEDGVKAILEDGRLHGVDFREDLER